MKVVSFNANSIRTRMHQLEAIVQKHQPDIIGLQETKVQDEEFPQDAVREMGYEVDFFGQKTHYGVALMYKFKPLGLRKGYPSDMDDAQRRVIAATFELPGSHRLKIINAYFPQGENRSHAVKFAAKEKFYADLMGFLDQFSDPKELLLIMGDFNIATQDVDVGLGERNAKRWLQTGKCSFLPEEREWMTRLLNWGLVDTFRSKHPEVDDQFSWFDYRSRGFEADPKRGLRIDTVLATKPLAKKILDAGIDHDVRAMERPSDHCPVWAEFAF
jgi:exodeoxyribonuclease-3